MNTEVKSLLNRIETLEASNLKLQRSTKTHRAAIFLMGSFALLMIAAGAADDGHLPEIIDHLRVRKLTVVDDQSEDRVVLAGGNIPLLVIDKGRPRLRVTNDFGKENCNISIHSLKDALDGTKPPRITLAVHERGNDVPAYLAILDKNYQNRYGEERK